MALARLKGRAAEARDMPAKLRSALEDALSLCDALLGHIGKAEFEVERLKRYSAEQALDYEHLFDAMPIACVVTDLTGRILHANPEAAALLNVSAKRLPDRLLLHFIDERTAFQKLLDGLQPYMPMRSTLTVRPRERARVPVTVHLLAAARGEGTVGLCFFTSPPRYAGATVPDEPQLVGASIMPAPPAVDT